MKRPTRLNYKFFRSLLWHQNKHHKHGVFVHSLKVVYYLMTVRRLDLVPAGFLHDIGKPFVAYQKDEDKASGDYSFTNHEEISYHLIKNFASDKTCEMVRYHYHIRAMQKAKERNQIGKYNRYKRQYDKLSTETKADLGVFLAADDCGKL